MPQHVTCHDLVSMP